MTQRALRLQRPTTPFATIHRGALWIAGPSVLILIGLPAVGWALQQDIQKVLPSVFGSERRQ